MLQQKLFEYSDPTLLDAKKSGIEDESDVLPAPELVDELPLRNLCGHVFKFSSRAAVEAGRLNHSLHKYPAKYIPQIPRWSFRYVDLQPGSSVLDPFCGSGTTLVEGMIAGHRSFGADISPIARLITRAKTSCWHERYDRVYDNLRRLETRIRCDQSVVNLVSSRDIKLHPTWEFWFPAESMKQLIKLKRHIRGCKLAASASEAEKLRTFLLVALSAIAKRVSYLDERQIKVRLHREKFVTGSPPDAVDTFFDYVYRHAPRHAEFSKIVEKSGGTCVQVSEDARNLNIPTNSIDHIVCSPPYLNAIDYPMAHKYNLFLLDLIAPAQFKDHCRDYIGMTERAVNKDLLRKIVPTDLTDINVLIDELSLGNNVDKVRAYIVSSYFNDMKKALQEMHRVLKWGSTCIIALGAANRIRGRFINTGFAIAELAVQAGFQLRSHFYHQVERRRIKFKRASNAGLITHEVVLTLKKPAR